jgi:molecular chaperone GrpE
MEQVCNIQEDPTPELSPTELLQQEVTKWQDAAMRAAAETDNIRKRTDKEKMDARRYGVAPLAMDLLEVLDNFARSLQNKPTDMMALDGFLTGLMMTEQQLHTAFTKHGLQRLDPLGVPFDPNLHQAIAELPSAEQSGTVLQVMQVGWMLHDRLLRPAMVIVAKTEA